MKFKTSHLQGAALDIAVRYALNGKAPADYVPNRDNFSSCWNKGGPLMDSENITVIRAEDDFEVDAAGFTTSKRIRRWFAETSRWAGHSLSTSYEGEHMEPTFMISEQGGYYGTTQLQAGMRALVGAKLGEEVEIPDALLTGYA